MFCKKKTFWTNHHQEKVENIIKDKITRRVDILWCVWKKLQKKLKIKSQDWKVFWVDVSIIPCSNDSKYLSWKLSNSLKFLLIYKNYWIIYLYMQYPCRREGLESNLLWNSCTTEITKVEMKGFSALNKKSRLKWLIKLNFVN